MTAIAWWRSTAQQLRYAEGNSAILRALLRACYREGHVYRVPWGPLRGTVLRYDRSITFHDMLGLRELRNFAVLSTVWKAGGWLTPRAVICDVGANIGVYTVWFARRLAGPGRVYAFEPAPAVADRLRDTLVINRVMNATVVAQACADRVGLINFFLADNHHCSSLDAVRAGGSGHRPHPITVQATTLDQFFMAGPAPREAPDFIKMDIEGGGVFALKGCDACVRLKQPLMLIESHSPAEDRAISDLLVRHDYQAYRVTDGRWVEAIRDTHPNPGGVWGTLLLCPSAARAALASRLAGGR